MFIAGVPVPVGPAMKGLSATNSHVGEVHKDLQCVSENVTQTIPARGE